MDNLFGSLDTLLNDSGNEKDSFDKKVKDEEDILEKLDKEEGTDDSSIFGSLDDLK